MPMAENSVSTSIRLRPTLKAQLERIAAAERRTTNNWIVITLEDAVARYLAEHPEIGEGEGSRPS
jgi:predicted transcriptional regulator